MKLNKYGFNNLKDIIGELVFLDSDDEFVILTKVISFKAQARGVSFVNSSIPVAKFIINKTEKKVTLVISHETYDSLVKQKVIDETCDNPNLLRAYEDFTSEFTKYTLTGDINAE